MYGERYNFSMRGSPDDWRATSKQLAAWRDQFREDAPKMAKLDVEVISQKLEEVATSLKPQLYTRAMAEFKGQYSRYQKAKGKMVEADRKWINSQDAATLNAEIELAIRRVKAAVSNGNAARDLAAIHELARMSGDPIKQLALGEAGEAVSAGGFGPTHPMTSDVLGTGLQFNRFLQQTRIDRQELRKTPEYKAARDAATAEAEKLQGLHREILAMAEYWGDSQYLNDPPQLGLNVIHAPEELRPLDLVTSDKFGRIIVYDETEEESNAQETEAVA